MANMANWQSELDLSDVWGKIDTGELTIHELAGIVSIRLDKIRPSEDEEILASQLELVDAFLSISEDKECNVDDFDYEMQNIYDWADIKLDNSWNGKKICWVRTF